MVEHTFRNKPNEISDVREGRFNGKFYFGGQAEM